MLETITREKITRKKLKKKPFNSALATNEIYGEDFIFKNISTCSS